MVKMISCDTSTKKSGLAIYIDGELSSYKLIDLSKEKNTEERINHMIFALLSYIDKEKPSVIYCETPQGHGGNVKLARMLSSIIGAIKGWACLNDCYFEEMNPSVWRKYIDGFEQGNLSRPELKLKGLMIVKERYGIDAESDDVSDAILIGKAMINRYGGMKG